VIGVFEHRKGQLFQNPQVEKQVIVPLGPMRSIIPRTMNILSAPWQFPRHMAEAQDEIRAVLRRRRHVAYSDPDNFGLSTATQVADQFKQITGAVALLTAVVSSIGLLVGGVGVMNIMLMSVYAAHARNRSPQSHWSAIPRRHLAVLTEAVVLTGAGGIIGVSLGVVISLLINKFLPRLSLLRAAVGRPSGCSGFP